MKKLFSILTLVVVFVMSAQAQSVAGKHLSVGVSLGTDGIGVDVATIITPNVYVRAGGSFLPALKFGTNVNVNIPTISTDQQEKLDLLGVKVPNIDSSVKVNLKPKMASFKVLVDLFPVKNSSFRFTVGAYIGGSQVATAVNSDESAAQIRAHNAALDDAVTKLDAFNKEHGTTYSFDPSPYKPHFDMGDYRLEPNKEGYANAEVKVSAFRPYVGIGFGNPVPMNKSLGFAFDLGVQIWGTPKVYCNGTELKKGPENKDVNKLLKTAQSIPVYPVLNFRLCGKLF